MSVVFQLPAGMVGEHRAFPELLANAHVDAILGADAGVLHAEGAISSFASDTLSLGAGVGALEATGAHAALEISFTSHVVFA